MDCKNISSTPIKLVVTTPLPGVLVCFKRLLICLTCDLPVIDSMRVSNLATFIC